MSAPRLRLLADDLTGALDATAELTGLCGPVPVAWDDATDRTGSLALDSGTREAPRELATARVRALAPALAGAGIAFKKIDSLLRGHVAAELAACLATRHWAHVVLAPAFPAQGRITRAGQVLRRQTDGSWTAVACDLLAALQAEGLRPVRGSCDQPLPSGVSIFDAEGEADLARIVTLGRGATKPVLWCGTAGLARALAGASAAPVSTALRSPVLGLFGSDQAVTARQLAACDACWTQAADGSPAEAARIAGLLEDSGAAMVSLALPLGLDRAEAARRIAAALAGLLQRLPRPGTLAVAGGETLHAICRALGARSLEATGLVAAGVPRSVMRGGIWDGLEVVSKSGAFGGDTLWRDLLAGNGLLTRSIDA
ncbi:four-carbon acid sugar kinase family protein [Falsiroseomonas oryzae]|uniref:four-carbon acid sugar kinase family protein n=1 Tax=Falsiroseomonas oryzae TaxID=2766473 RepID=UPI0022EB2FE1|nr:four-carbon acid sugar kinase family protein [Roseomonas sp. MO-31]